MATPQVIAPGAGEIIGDTADRRVEILCETAALHATWSRFGPGRDGADRHIHRNHTDLFYVLDGELMIKLADGEASVPAGSLAIAPPFAVHGFRNAADADVRYLNLHAPGCGFAGYMRGLRDGLRVDFDQADPPADGAPAPAEASISTGAAEDDGVTALAELERVAVAELALEPGASAEHDALAAYVLSGEVEVAAGIVATAGSWINFGERESARFAAGGLLARVLAIDVPPSALG